MKLFVRSHLALILVLSICAVAVQAVDLTILERSGIDRIDEPVTSGVTFPEGYVTSVNDLVLSVNGEPVPAEIRPVAFWYDNSIRWVHVDFQTSVTANDQLTADLSKGTPAQVDSKFDIVVEDEGYTISTGKIKAQILGAGFNVFNSVWLVDNDGNYSTQLVAPHDRGLILETGGIEYTSSNDQTAVIELESDGSMRKVFKVSGILTGPSGETNNIHYICRLYFFNNSRIVRLAYTFENRNSYSEGSEDKVVFDVLDVEVPVVGDNFHFTTGFANRNDDAAINDGSEAWIGVPSTTLYQHHVNGATTDKFSPKDTKTDRIGWIGISAGGKDNGQGIVAVALKYFWELAPTTIEFSDASSMLTVGVVPERMGQPVDIYSGVARTFYLRFAFLDPGEEEKIESSVAGAQKPLKLVETPEFYCREAKAFGPHVNESNDAYYPAENLELVQDVETKLLQGFVKQLDQVDSRTKNSVTGEGYGLMGWGDGMHYAWESGVQDPRNIAWNGHYYDLPWMVGVQFGRTADYRWYDYFVSRARHLMDIHTAHLSDGLILNGASRYCPPTDHVRVDPANSNDFTTARVYISPYTNHHKMQGLFLAWLMEGDERMYDVAVKGADYANHFGTYTDWKQPRGAAFQVFTLCAAYEATGDEEYLQTAGETFDAHWDYFSNSSNQKWTGGYFMVGFLLEAFIYYYDLTEDGRVIDWIQMGVDDMVANHTNEVYSNMAYAIGWLAYMLDDPEYTELQKKYLEKWQGSYSNTFKDYGSHGRSVQRALWYLSYEALGLEQPVSEDNGGDYNDDGQLSIHDVISLLLLGRSEPENPLADYNSDGAYSVNDAIALLLYIRDQIENGASLASVDYVTSPITDLSLEDKKYLMDAFIKMSLNDDEWEKVNAALGNPDLPRSYALSQNIPNPFNPSTTIAYQVAESSAVHVNVSVYNLRGELVRTLVDEFKDAGLYNVFWDGTDNKGSDLSSGVYFYRMSAGKFSQTRKMVLLK